MERGSVYGRAGARIVTAEFLRRLIDVGLALLILGALSPLLLLLVVIGKLELRGHGSLFLREELVGRGFKRFGGFRFSAPGVDSLLRNLRLEDLPRLLNVLRGEMSLVGPRPEPPCHVALHQQDFSEILTVRPGILDMTPCPPCTGNGTIPPSPQELESPEATMLDKIEVNGKYVRTATLATYFKIIYRGVKDWIACVVTHNLLRGAERLIRWLRPYRRPIVVALQATLVVLSTYVAFIVRFEGDIPPEHISLFLGTMPTLFILRMAGFVPFGLFAGLWRYVGVRDLRNITASVTLSSVALYVVVNYAMGMSYPRSIMILDALLLVGLLAGVRSIKRVLFGLSGKSAQGANVLIIGAGNAGEALLREIERHPDYRYRAVGFVDDDATKRGTTIRGIRVLGSRKDLSGIIGEHKVSELLVAVPSASREKMTEIICDCRRTGLPVKALPGFREALFGGGYLTAMRDVKPEDLLFRAPILLDDPAVKNFYRGRTVMVTGAGGSIGSELVRQFAQLEPERIILFERHENSLFFLELELRRLYPSLELVPVIGDIQDSARVSQVLVQYKPSVIFHAAAYKHVPMMELNPQEAVKVNVLGTKSLVDAATRAGVERFVFISTDKAVRPANVMGATKRLAEVMLQEVARDCPMKLMTVRFGNVLESSGSVVPVFKEQIRRGGPVTITDPNATRYFMTTAEAVHLVLNAAMIGKGGEIFVLDMGEPIKILQMARQLISLYGYEPGREIKIVFTGLRPGEKLHEELFTEEEKVQRTEHPKIMVAIRPEESARSKIPERVPMLEQMIRTTGHAGDLKKNISSILQYS